MRKLIAAFVLVAAISLPGSAFASLADTEVSLKVTPSKFKKGKVTPVKLTGSVKGDAAPNTQDVSTIGSITDAVASASIGSSVEGLEATTEDAAKADTAPATSEVGNISGTVGLNGTNYAFSGQLLYAGPGKVIALLKVPSFNNLVAAITGDLSVGAKATKVTIPLSAAATLIKGAGGSGGAVTFDVKFTIGTNDFLQAKGCPSSGSFKVGVKLNPGIGDFNKKIACKVKK